MSAARGGTGTPVPSAVVVGGGIGGLAATRALQLAGWSVQVLEQTAHLEPLGAGISVWPNGVRALLSLAVPLPDQAGPLGTGGIRAQSGGWLSRTSPADYPARYGAPLIAVHRAYLQHALLSTLVPDTVLTGIHVTGVQPRPDGVLVRHSRGEQRADLVVLADGLASPTRHLVAGTRPRVRYAGYTAWRGLTRHGADLPRLGGATESWGAASGSGSSRWRTDAPTGSPPRTHPGPSTRRVVSTPRCCAGSPPGTSPSTRS